MLDSVSSVQYESVVLYGTQSAVKAGSNHAAVLLSVSAQGQMVHLSLLVDGDNRAADFGK